MKIKYRYDELGKYKQVEVEVSDEVANALYDLLREDEKLRKREQRHRVKQRLNENTLLDNEPTTEDTVIQKECVMEIQSALSKLTPTEQSRIITYFYEGLTYRDIAKIEDVKCSSIYESINNALIKMRKLLKL